MILSTHDVPPPTSGPRQPTARQRPILTILAMEALTTAQLQAHITPPVTRRALELRLQRLAGYGWVQATVRTMPGTQQPRQYWRLLAAGASAAGLALPSAALPARPTPSRRPPTPEQREILEMLTDFTYLTTAQIASYVAAPISQRALQFRLSGLRERGWIAETRLQPERGAASQRAWKLLPAGGVVLGTPEWVRPPLSLTTLRPILVPTDPAPALHPDGRAILTLLAYWKALTTEQIARWVWNRWPCTGAMQAVFADLRARHLAHDQDLAPEEGTHSPHYWQLLTAGAALVGLDYGSHYRKRPLRSTLDHRGMLLELVRQVAAAGWQLLPPHTARPSDPLREDSAQAQRLKVTVLDYKGRELAARAAYGESDQALAEDRAQHREGLIGAVLPRFVNDWVAYLPDDPVRTVLLIPHPPHAGLGFWANKPEAARRRDEPVRRESRLERYRRLAAMLPVIAVFPRPSTAAPYAKILTAGGFQWATVDQIAARLRRI